MLRHRTPRRPKRIAYAATGRGIWRQTLTAPAPAWTDFGPVLPVGNRPEMRSLALGHDAVGDGEPDLYGASWGFGLFRMERPISGSTIAPFGMRTGYVTMLALAQAHVWAEE